MCIFSAYSVNLISHFQFLPNIFLCYIALVLSGEDMQNTQLFEFVGGQRPQRDIDYFTSLAGGHLFKDAAGRLCRYVDHMLLD